MLLRGCTVWSAAVGGGPVSNVLGINEGVRSTVGNDDEKKKSIINNTNRAIRDGESCLETSDGFGREEVRRRVEGPARSWVAETVSCEGDGAERLLAPVPSTLLKRCANLSASWM